jgi:eukaryotic-like serine/threonine-protein kinase
VPHIDASPGVLERFYREARAAATHNDPNICPVFDVGTHNGIPYQRHPVPTASRT